MYLFVVLLSLVATPFLVHDWSKFNRCHLSMCFVAEVKVDEEPATVAEDDESNHRLKRSQLEAVGNVADLLMPYLCPLVLPEFNEVEKPIHIDGLVTIVSFWSAAASEEVRKMLRDHELQELISKIDSSPNSKAVSE